MAVYCGIDWAEGHHDIALVDSDGTLVAKRRISESADGFAELTAMLAAAGDSAAVPDLTKGPGELTGPSAQHAVRQAARLADNLVAILRGKAPTEYRHKYVGSVASLGLYKGVAQVYGVKVKGYPAWFMHRTYHLLRIPSFNRKVRVVIDWTLALFLRREVVALGELHEPRGSFTEVTPPVSH